MHSFIDFHFKKNNQIERLINLAIEIDIKLKFETVLNVSPINKTKIVL